MPRVFRREIRLIISIIAMMWLGAAHAQVQETTIFHEAPSKSIEVKAPAFLKSAKLTFIELKTKLKMEFEASGLRRGLYVIGVSDKCRADSAMIGWSEFAKAVKVLTEFKMNSDAISHEASTRDYALSKDSPNSIQSLAISVLRKEGGGYRVVDCEVMK